MPHSSPPALIEAVPCARSKPTRARPSSRSPTCCPGAPTLAVLARRTYDVDPRPTAPREEQSPLVTAPLDDPELPGLLAADPDFHPQAAHRRRLAGPRVRPGARPTANVLSASPATSNGSPSSASAPARSDRAARSASPSRPARPGPAVLRPRLRRPRPRRRGPPRQPARAQPPSAEHSAASTPTPRPVPLPAQPGRPRLPGRARPRRQRRFELPALEDPPDLLTPERLLCDWLDGWHRMPLPQATGWFIQLVPADRVRRHRPFVEQFDEPPLEVERGLVPDYLAEGPARPIRVPLRARLRRLARAAAAPPPRRRADRARTASTPPGPAGPSPSPPPPASNATAATPA